MYTDGGANRNLSTVVSTESFAGTDGSPVQCHEKGEVKHHSGVVIESDLSYAHGSRSDGRSDRTARQGYLPNKAHEANVVM